LWPESKIFQNRRETLQIRKWEAAVQVSVSTEIYENKAMTLAKEHGIQDFKASRGWMERLFVKKWLVR
jgi:hypothetical protein